MEHVYGPVTITVVVVWTEDPDVPLTVEGLTEEEPEITVFVEGWTEIGVTEIVGFTDYLF